MLINLIHGSGYDGAAADIKTAWQTAANILDAAFTDNITVNITVTYGDHNTTGADCLVAGGDLLDYQSVYNLLTTNASLGDASFSSLPNAASIQGQTKVAVWDAQRKAFGLIDPNKPASDATVDFGNAVDVSDMVAGALHEFTHAMGRVQDNGGSGDPNIFDLFRFTGTNTRLFTEVKPSAAASFSLNNGFSHWADYGINSDPADTLNSSLLTTNDSFNESLAPAHGDLNYLTPFDLEQMDVLGYHLSHPANVDSFDFNGDNSGDILVQNFSTGDIDYLNMLDGSPHGWTNLATTPGWVAVGQGKIAGGPCSDVVIENISSGDIWYADVGPNGTFSNWVNYNANLPGSWLVTGVGDINGDFHADIVAQNTQTGEIDYARTSASGVTTGALDQWVPVATTPGWFVVGTGDLNDDGFADIVVENSSTGAIDYANMANGVFTSWGVVGTTPGWNVVGVGDIDRNGSADVVIQQQSTGQIDYAKMNHDGTFGSWVAVGTAPGWRVIGVEDILANGFNDIVIQENSTGKIDYADMTLGRFNQWVAVTSTPGWTGVTRPEDGGTPVAVSMADPGPQDDAAPTAVQMFDPGPQNDSVLAAVRMFDPGPADVSPTAVRMFDPGPQTEAGNVAASSLFNRV